MPTKELVEIFVALCLCVEMERDVDVLPADLQKEYPGLDYKEVLHRIQAVGNVAGEILSLMGEESQS